MSVLPIRGTNNLQFSVPMVTGASVSGIPEVIHKELGPLAERRVFRSAGLTPQVLAYEDTFIPEHSLFAFVDAAVREAGVPYFGLVIAPHLSLTRYGTWGRYVLEGETLGKCVSRFKAAMPLHASYSTFTIERKAGLAWVKYRFPTASHPAYANVALCALGFTIDFLRRYAGANWIPEAIQFDLPRPAHAADIEDAFLCRMHFNTSTLGIAFDPALMQTPRRDPLPETRTTLADVARARSFRPPVNLEGIVRELVRVQIRSRAVSLDSAACAIGYGTRRLQRALAREGISFRNITRSVRKQTAKELITQTSLPVSAIGADLGYASDGHFSRAFRRDVGCTPSEYRQRFKIPSA